MRVTSLYICPWSLRDPLCQSQSLAYIRQLVTAGNEFSLITFEIAAYRQGPLEIAAEKEQLHSEGIDWYPVNWDGGTSLGAKIGGIFRVLYTGFQVCRKNRPSLIHSRSSLPVFMAVCLKKLFRTKYLYDADSMLSEEYADIGHLSRETFGFKFLAWSEKWARKNADHIIVLTEKLKDEYRNKFEMKKQIDVIPCCVDLKRFANVDENRSVRRAEVGIVDERLFIYVGKAGSWYLTDETFDLFRVALAHDPNSRLLIITPDKPNVFDAIAERAGVPPFAYFVRFAGFETVGEWMAAADVGLALIKPVSSKRGSSPVKFAEYLASGLPVISTSGIGDIDDLIKKNKIGAIIDEFTSDAYASAIQQIEELGDVRDRCREVTRKEFDLDAVGGERFRQLYRRLLIDADTGS